MEITRTKALLILASLLAITCASLLWIGSVEHTGETGVITSLPDRIGSWKASDILICQNPACSASVNVNIGNSITNCPYCGSALAIMSLPERDLMPRDITLSRRRYTNPEGITVIATVVLMGQDHSGLHRPQACLPGQGFRIVKESTKSVSDQKIVVLTLRHEHSRRKVYYAYWFIGPHAETHNRIAMKMRMAWARLITGRADRWAYVSVMMPADKSPKPTIKVLLGFTQALRDQIVLARHQDSSGNQ